jgi:predicted RNA-binding Zn-ribbon protein involved in translation (DUF1610 family)
MMEWRFNMDNFESLKQKFTDTAKFLVKKSNDLAEITKININISTEEDKIKKVYYEIGKAIYKSYRSNESDEKYKSECEKIRLYEKNIEEMKKKIRDIKSIKVCDTCGSELEDEMGFCFKCGNKQEVDLTKTEKDDNVDNSEE